MNYKMPKYQMSDGVSGRLKYLSRTIIQAIQRLDNNLAFILRPVALAHSNVKPLLTYRPDHQSREERRWRTADLEEGQTNNNYPKNSVADIPNRVF